jgi:hypothetical protein
VIGRGAQVGRRGMAAKLRRHASRSMMVRFFFYHKYLGGFWSANGPSLHFAPKTPLPFCPTWVRSLG